MSSRAELHLCVPVLRRYDLLCRMLESLDESTVLPHTVHVIDNGRRPVVLAEALLAHRFVSLIDIFIPEEPMGVAESWNWFIAHTDGERLIVNDDVEFAPRSVEQMLNTPGALVTGLRGNAFSCFLLRDECLQKVGWFDETISPGYAYFEDCDYEERMRAAGLTITHCGCGVTHVKSATLAVLSPNEQMEHNRKFVIAQENFIRKHGKLPEGMEKQLA